MKYYAVLKSDAAQASSAQVAEISVSEKFANKLLSVASEAEEELEPEDELPPVQEDNNNIIITISKLKNFIYQQLI